MIAQGTARVGVMIPPDFHDKRARRDNAQFLVLIDGSDSNVSAQALASINGLAAAQNLDAARALGARPVLSAQPIVLFNPDGPNRELHHPRPRRDPPAARRDGARVDRDRARARAGHDGAAAGHADPSGRPRARQARALPRDRHRRDGADPPAHALGVRRADPGQPRVRVRDRGDVPVRAARARA